jgi:hypothetical protein
VASYRVVYPDGSTQELVGDSAPEIDAESSTPDGQRVVARYVRSKERGGGPTVYLDSAPGSEARPRKLISFVIRGSRCPVTLAEAAELGDRTRRFSGGAAGSPATAVAGRIEDLIEARPGDAGELNLHESEESALRWVIYQWLIDVGARHLPERIMELRYGLYVGSEAADETG